MQICFLSTREEIEVSEEISKVTTEQNLYGWLEISQREERKGVLDTGNSICKCLEVWKTIAEKLVG